MDTGTFHKKSSYLPSWTQSEKGKGKLARGRIARLRKAKSHVTVKVSPDWCRLPVTENRELLLLWAVLIWMVTTRIPRGLSYIITHLNIFKYTIF